jgi:hypothetical protein
MSTAGAIATTSPGTLGRAIQVILTAGLVCGVLDGLSAVLVSGVGWLRVFQFIASGILGPKSFQEGAGTAFLGIGLHFLIAVGAATVYYVASRGLTFMVHQALISGVLFGIAVHLFMSFIVVPASAIGPRPFVLRSFLVFMIVHMVVVGPSIALTIRHYSR